MSRDQLPSSSTPTIFTKTLVTAGVEGNQILVVEGNPTLKKIMIKSRTTNDLKFSWVSSGNFVTIPSGQTYWDDGLDKPVATIYLIGTLNGQIAEIQVWQ